MKKKHLHLEMSADVAAKLESLREQTQAADRAEVIRHALSVYDFLLSQVGKGDAIILRGPEGERCVDIRADRPKARK